ncbi:MAG: hypothetical protein ABI475_04040 [Methylophilaceae bacterium]
MHNTALKRWLVLGGLLGLTLYLAWSSPEPETQSMATVNPTRATAAVSGLRMASQPARQEWDFRFTPREAVGGEVVDLFAPAVVERPPEVAETVELPPQAPALPFTLVGRIIEGDGIKVFLQANNDVLYSVKVGDIFAQQYKLVGAEGGKISLLYLPLNITQTMPYGETP